MKSVFPSGGWVLEQCSYLKKLWVDRNMLEVEGYVMSEEERKILEGQLYVVGICLLFGGIGARLLWGFLPSAWTGFFRVPCVFHEVTGLYCPGCGGTRAVGALLQREAVLSFFIIRLCFMGR